MLSLLTNLFALLGISLLAYYIYKIGSDIYVLFIHKSTLPRYLSPSSSNSYALITGASDGIGRGCAEELISRGFNVILHGRNPTKLERVKTELLAQWPTRQVRTLILDAAASARDPDAIKAKTSELESQGIKVSILINNVGGATGVPRAWVPLHLRESKEIDILIDVNAAFTSQLTRAMLPLLFKSQPALIINIGSVTGELPSPYLTPYSGSKAYIAAWSRGLKLELRCEKRDVEVIHISVGESSSYQIHVHLHTQISQTKANTLPQAKSAHPTTAAHPRSSRPVRGGWARQS